MNDSPNFTFAWKAAIVVALVASLATSTWTVKDRRIAVSVSAGKADTQILTNPKYEKRLDEMENKIAKIEKYLYDTVATEDSKNKQRLSEVEKSIKEVLAVLREPSLRR